MYLRLLFFLNLKLYMTNLLIMKLEKLVSKYNIRHIRSYLHHDLHIIAHNTVQIPNKIQWHKAPEIMEIDHTVKL